MSLRPKQAHWFETYVSRTQTIKALGVLAESGLVELESDPRLAMPLDLSRVSQAVAEFRRIVQEYQKYLPEISPTPASLMKAPDEVAATALDWLKQWQLSTDGLLQRHQGLQAELQNLRLLADCLQALEGSDYDLQRISHTSEFLYTGLFACPHERRPGSEICASIEAFFPGRVFDYFIVAGLPKLEQTIELACQEKSCLRIEVPLWLTPDATAQPAQVEERIRTLEDSIAGLKDELKRSSHDPKLASAVGDLALLSWFVEHAGEVSKGRHKFCHITGWTTSEQPQELELILREAEIHTAVRFATAPDYCRVPVRLLLPAWARPFLFFVDMLGTPDSNEVDPGLLLPVTISLLFGYMFPDVGHGLLLALFSTLLYRRWPQGRFLIPCGLSAILFGFVFGEIFGLEGILVPLWISPMEHPLLLLLPPMLLGAVLMLLGLVFNGVEAYWRGESRAWLWRDAAVLAMYGSALIGIFHPLALWASGLALLWYLIGQLQLAKAQPLRRLLAGIAQLLQSLFELLLNTISFLRVGAFALAHAALTGAVLQIAEGITNPVAHGLFLLLGHLLILIVEGMVVFVQTTRLILFEFFTHFLRAEGRLFQPLSKLQDQPGEET